MEVVLLILVIQGLVFGFFCSYIAREKNRDGTSWFWLGFFFSILTLLTLIAVPKAEINSQNLSGDMKKCQFCAEYVKYEAKLCKHCGRDLVNNGELNGTNLYPYSFVHGDHKIVHDNRSFIVNGKKFGSSDDAKAYAETL